MRPSRDRATSPRPASYDIGERDDATRDGAPRAVIVSDVRLYREALAWGLAQTGRVDVIASAHCAEAVYVQTSHLAPDVVVVDRAMANSLAIARTVVQRSRAKVVAFAIAGIQNAVIECAEAGMSGYVTREASIDELVETIERAVRGQVVCSPRATATLARRLDALPASTQPANSAEAAPVQRSELTQREREVAGLVERGLSNKEIATCLRIGTATVKNHVHSILEKLTVSRRGEAAALLRGSDFHVHDGSSLEGGV